VPSLYGRKSTWRDVVKSLPLDGQLDAKAVLNSTVGWEKKNKDKSKRLLEPLVTGYAYSNREFKFLYCHQKKLLAGFTLQILLARSQFSDCGFGG
jgi:hypothetical protein